MSTRVHELAKELGLKSQELIDRIQKGGFEVKPSPLASLDPEMVSRIRDHVQGRGRPAPGATGTGMVAAPRPKAVETAATPEAQPQPAGPPIATPTAPPTVPPQVAAAPSAAPAAPLASPPRAAPQSHPVTTASPALASPPASSRHTAPGPLSMHTRSAAGGTPPLHRTGGGGPLSGHTPHRTGSAPRADAPAGPTSTGPASDSRPQAGGPGEPIRPTDYIGPAGTRTSFAAPRGAGGTAPPPVRRPMQRPGSSPGAPSDQARRDPPLNTGPRRPLPSVAPTAPSAPPRRTDGPRPGGPEVKVQKPERKFTPEEMRALMQSGGLNALAGTSPARPGMAPRPGLTTRPGAPGRPGSAPPGAPARRPPGPIPPGAGVGIAPPPPPIGTESSEDDDRRGKGGRPGGSADRAGRRAKRAERATERARVTSPVDARTLLDDDESQRSRGPRRLKGQHRGALIAPRKAIAQLEPPITVRALSEGIGVKANDLMRKLMAQGQLVTINTTIDDEVAQMLALEFGTELQVVHARTAEDDFADLFEDAPGEEVVEGLEARPPVITILGHVDHGKTSLLDRARQSNVVATESGGITQHIGAYQIEHNGKRITFVDTPGHEAFTAMRARGANVTDIVVLVVAADDGVMPQTKEAIAHAKAAEVPVVVALNKIDLPNVDSPSNLNKIYGELSQEGLIPEEYGGDVPVVKTSAISGRGIEDLLETLEVVAELHELRANPNKLATGTCLEASISEGRGVLATVLVQDGTLRVGDVVVCGSAFGRARALFDDRGRPVEAAPPSFPVAITGLDQVPTAGEKFAVIPEISRAREVAESRRDRSRVASATERQALTLENLFKQVADQKVKSLNLIMKADVQGSLEALSKEIEKLQNDEVPIRVLLKGVGAITESDVILADASSAIILGFRVTSEDRAITLADEKSIDIRRYDIIYQVTDQIKLAIEGMLVPEYKETLLGKAVVQQVFKISKVGIVAGCMVLKGTIERNAKVRLFRDGGEIFKGDLSALKRFKEDVREVRENFECGIKIANYDDIKVGDVIDVYKIEVIRRTL